jgi:MFS family permease
VGLENTIPKAGLIFGSGLIALSMARSLPLAAVCIAVASFGMISQMASSNTIIQTVVDDDKRGRVMAIYAMAFMGMAPFGSLLAGWIASRLGAPHTIMISGLMSMAGALAFFTRLGEMRAKVRPVYQRMGISPEMASGLQSAAALTAPPED